MLRRESTSAKEWGLAAGLALGLLVAAVAAECQQAGKVHRLGYLSIGSASEAPNRLDVFRQGLRELRYTDLGKRSPTRILHEGARHADRGRPDPYLEEQQADDPDPPSDRRLHG